MLELQSEKALFECLPGTFKKLVSVSTTSSLVTETSKEDDVALQRVLYIHYPIWFKKKEVQVLIDSGSEVNAMLPAYASKLGFNFHHTDVEAQKIDDSTFETFGIVQASFQIEDKLGRIRFFQEMFLLADISTEVVVSMSFLTLSNIDV